VTFDRLFCASRMAGFGPSCLLAPIGRLTSTIAKTLGLGSILERNSLALERRRGGPADDVGGFSSFSVRKNKRRLARRVFRRLP
jgi:hypothetical protein